METQKSTSGTSNNGGKSFFQDTQKLTFAFGLSAGLAFMAIVALVVVVVNNGTGTSEKNTNTVAAANTNTDTNAADATLYDAVRIASMVSGMDMSKFQLCLSASTYTKAVDDSISAATTAGVQGTPTSFINGTEISGAQPYAQLKTAIDAAIAGTKGTAAVPAVTKDDHQKGAKSPKVTLIEYSDFQCPYCQQFNTSVQQALAEYGDKLMVVFRHFPLESIHPYARSLAEGSECAGAQGKFWEFHDAVFSGA